MYCMYCMYCMYICLLFFLSETLDVSIEQLVLLVSKTLGLLFPHRGSGCGLVGGVRKSPFFQ